MSVPSTAVSRNNWLSNSTVDSPTELIGGVEYSGVCVRTPEDIRYSSMPTPPDTDTNEYHIDWNMTENTPLTVPVKLNSGDVENALSLQENMNREDRLVASRYMLSSVSVMRDRDIAPVVEILDTRSNLMRQIIILITEEHN